MCQQTLANATPQIPHSFPACRYRVVYRLVNGVYVMTVAAAHTNVFYMLQLVEGAVRVLVAACKGVDVTPDKVTRRYPEVGTAALSWGSLSGGRVVPF